MENPTGGVKSFSIAGRLVRQRERLAGMTDDERRWRAQWLKDQELGPEEPRFVPEYYYDTNNIFRRIWQFPARQIEALAAPFLGKERAVTFRLGSTVLFKCMIAAFTLGYIFKYHSNDFTSYRTFQIWVSRPTMHPDDPGYPAYHKKSPQELYDNGFYSSVLCVEVIPPPPPPPPPPKRLIVIPDDAECDKKVTE